MLPERPLVNRIRLGILALQAAVLVWSEDTRANWDWAQLFTSTR